MSLFRPTRRPRRFLAEIVTEDERLLRRERYTTETASEAASAFLMFWKYLRGTCPGAAFARFYRTSDEPTAPAVLTVDLRRAFQRLDGQGVYYKMHHTPPI